MSLRDGSSRRVVAKLHEIHLPPKDSAGGETRGKLGWSPARYPTVPDCSRNQANLHYSWAKRIEENRREDAAAEVRHLISADMVVEIEAEAVITEPRTLNEL